MYRSRAHQCSCVCVLITRRSLVSENLIQTWPKLSSPTVDDMALGSSADKMGEEMETMVNYIAISCKPHSKPRAVLSMLPNIMAPMMA